MKLTDDVKQILATFLKHLDLELKKFKSELEVDKSGTTELIEKSNCSIHITCIVISNELILNKYITFL